LTDKNTKVFAIADLHLEGSQDKPMGIFGEHWDNHWDKIKESWIKNIGDDDIVIIPGDISWAMSLDDAIMDIEELGKLPGHQIFIKGNHDFWWSSYTKVCDILSAKQHIIQNTAIKIDDVVIAGTRGWLCPNSQDYKEKDEKIYKREAIRLELSLDAAAKLMDEKSTLIAAMHFPPFALDKEPTLFTELLQKYLPASVAFGHIHSPVMAKKYEGELNGIEYIMTACDYIDFEPIRIL